MATITIQASDAPHGVVEFQTSSVFVSSGETTPTQLTLVRQFGSFGELDLASFASFRLFFNCMNK